MARLLGSIFRGVVVTALASAAVEGARRLAPGFTQRFASPSVQIKFAGGRAKCLKGALPSRKLRDIEEILAGEGIAAATLGIRADQRVSFSAGMSAGAMQRIRNVLVNG